jgi:hypothetical protein
MALGNGRPRLDVYVRHAERYGTKLVCEKAAAGASRPSSSATWHVACAASIGAGGRGQGEAEACRAAGRSRSEVEGGGRDGRRLGNDRDRDPGFGGRARDLPKRLQRAEPGGLGGTENGEEE